MNQKDTLQPKRGTDYVFFMAAADARSNRTTKRTTTSTTKMVTFPREESWSKMMSDDERAADHTPETPTRRSTVRRVLSPPVVILKRGAAAPFHHHNKNEGDDVPPPPVVVPSSPPPPLPPSSPLSDPTGFDEFVTAFPIPGEPWCHLFTVANYYSSLLHNHPPPGPGEMPYLVNSWQQVLPTQHSPYRILYGTHNPAIRGIVITSSTVIPNFSWTPRMALGVEGLSAVLDGPLSQARTGDVRVPGAPPVVVVPAVHGRVLRLFAHDGMWYVASNHRLEALPHQCDAPVTTYLGLLFEGCLLRYYARSLWHFTRDLSPALCWFFAVYPGRQSMLFLGTCRVLPHRVLQDHVHHLDLAFALHDHLPAAVPILPAELPTATRTRLLRERLHSVRTIQYTDLYDGLLVFNPQTMFAIRLCYPTMVYLTPLLKHHQPMNEFLAMRVAQARLVDLTHPTVDHATLHWYRSLESMTDEYFAAQHGPLLDHLRWQADNTVQWLTTWMMYISSLCWDEWSALDIDLQRLYVILDYEHGSNWYHKILCNPKYTVWIAKLLVFCLEQQWGGTPPPPPAVTTTTNTTTQEEEEEEEHDNHNH